MKKVLILLCVLVFSMVATQAFAVEYDKNKVVGIMKSNGAMMGAIKKGLEAEDFFAVAEAFMTIATNMKSIEDMEPPKGDKEAWDANHSSLIKNALKAIGACGDEDAEKAGMYLGEIGKLIKEGHGMFK